MGREPKNARGKGRIRKREHWRTSRERQGMWEEGRKHPCRSAPKEAGREESRKGERRGDTPDRPPGNLRGEAFRGQLSFDAVVLCAGGAVVLPPPDPLHGSQACLAWLVEVTGSTLLVCNNS